MSPFANVITSEAKAWEQLASLPKRIGSTGSGTGAAVMARAARGSDNFPLSAVKAEDFPELQQFLRHDTTRILRELLDAGRRVVVEGTQGFGLSLLHGGLWPKATSRDTTASAFISEAGLSPLDVDDVTLVLRCHPIRVAGDFRPLARRGFLGDHCSRRGPPREPGRVHDRDAQASSGWPIRSGDCPASHRREPAHTNSAQSPRLCRSHSADRRYRSQSPVVCDGS